MLCAHLPDSSVCLACFSVTLTKNYLLICLAHAADESPSSGLLLHCISGWDRTPLFISLLRLSLWADGECHRSLNAMQILYLTIAYGQKESDASRQSLCRCSSRIHQ